MSDHCVHSHRTYYLLHFNYRAASRTVIFEMGPSIVFHWILDEKRPSWIGEADYDILYFKLPVPPIWIDLNGLMALITFS